MKILQLQTAIYTDLQIVQVRFNTAAALGQRIKKPLEKTKDIQINYPQQCGYLLVVNN